MPFLRNEFSKIFEDVFTMNVIYADDSNLWSNKGVKIKVKSLRLFFVTFWSLLVTFFWKSLKWKDIHEAFPPTWGLSFAECEWTRFFNSKKSTLLCNCTFFSSLIWIVSADWSNSRIFHFSRFDNRKRWEPKKPRQQNCIKKGNILSPHS